MIGRLELDIHQWGRSKTRLTINGRRKQDPEEGVKLVKAITPPIQCLPVEETRPPENHLQKGNKDATESNFDCGANRVVPLAMFPCRYVQF